MTWWQWLLLWAVVSVPVAMGVGAVLRGRCADDAPPRTGISFRVPRGWVR